MAAAWERPSVQGELSEARKEPPAPNPEAGHLAEAVGALAEYASRKIDERNEVEAAREVDQVANWAERVASDYEAEPEEVGYAADALVDAVGADDYRFGSFLESWQENDPEAAQEWLVERQWANYREGQAALGEIRAMEAQAAADRAQATQKMMEEWGEAHPDAGRYGPLMAELAARAGIDLNAAGPEELKVLLDATYEGVRQTDEAAAPIRGALGTGWQTSEAWERAQADNILNAGLSMRGRSETMEAFAARMHGLGFDVDVHGGVHSRPNWDQAISRASDASVPGGRLTPAQFDAQEQARLAEAWNLPTVQEELHGKRPSRSRTVEATPTPASDPDDPGGFWAYTLHGNY